MSHDSQYMSKNATIEAVGANFTEEFPQYDLSCSDPSSHKKMPIAKQTDPGVNETI